MVTIPSPTYRRLTYEQKLEALAHKYYQEAEWSPKGGDYYTSSRADLELYQVVSVDRQEGGGAIVTTRYCTHGMEDNFAEWEWGDFISQKGFGRNRVWVPPFVLSDFPATER